MGNIGDSISDTAPAVGTAGPGYATTINSILTEVLARLVAKIPLSSLLTNSDLDLNGQALLDASYITLVNEGVSPVASPSNRLTAYGGDVWWVSPSGAVQITDGAALNAAGIGGITGDYSGAGPMEFRYDTANTRYDAFANQSTNTWAYVRARGFDIAGSATSNFRLRQTWGGTANMAVVWPSTLPASTTQIVQVDTSGNLSFSNSNDNFGHGDTKISNIPRLINSTGSLGYGVASDVVGLTLQANAVAYIQLEGLRRGDRIKSVKIYGTSPGTTATFVVVDQVANAASALAATGSGDLGGTGYIVQTLTTPLTLLSDGETAYVRVTASATATSTLYEVETTFDHPAG